MSETMEPQTAEPTTPVESKPKKERGYNDRMKRDKLLRQAVRAHEWRVQVWAQSEVKIRAVNAALEAMGGEPYAPWDPDFTSRESLEHYSTMKLGK